MASRCYNVDRNKQFELKLSKILTIIDEPKLDTLQTSCHVERILFYSDSCTVLSDMKSKRTIASKVNADILIRLMISLSSITRVTKRSQTPLISNKNDLLDDLDVGIIFAFLILFHSFKLPRTRI